MNNVANLVVKQPDIKEIVNILPPCDLIITQLGINSTELKSLKPSLKTHYRTVITWLKKYQSQPNSSNLEKVKGYLEAFHHLCEISDYEKALKVIFTRLNTITNQELHKQLETWSYYQQRVDLYNRLLGNVTPELETVFFNGLGDSNLALGHYQEANKYYQKALKLAVEKNNYTEKGIALKGLGNICCLQGNYAIAENYYQQFLEIAKQIDNQEQIAQSLQNIGNIYQGKQKHEQAIKYYQLSLAICEDNNYCRGQATALLSLGKNYLFLKEYNLAIDYYTKSSQIYHYIGDLRGEIVTNFDLGFFLENLSKFEEAKHYYLISLNLAQQRKELKLDQTTINNLANVCYRLGYLKQAANYYEQYLKEVINPLEVANISNTLGGIYCYLKQFEQALLNLKKALEIVAQYEGKSALELIAKVWCNLGLIYNELGDFKTAINYSQKAQQIYHQFSNNTGKSGLSHVLGNLGISYRELGQFEIGINHLKQAYQIAVELNDIINQAAQLREIAITYRKTGQLLEAVENLENSKTLLATNPFPPEEFETFKQLSETYHELGNQPQAIQYQIEQHKLELIIKQEVN